MLSKILKKERLFTKLLLSLILIKEHDFIEKTTLADYAFEYGVNHTAILLGYGMLFNHSYTPNATYEINFDNHTFDFYAYTDIQAGEEILINYNGDEDDQELLWFDREDEEEQKVKS